MAPLNKTNHREFYQLKADKLREMGVEADRVTPQD
jgi:hypothetical protein